MKKTTCSNNLLIAMIAILGIACLPSTTKAKNSMFNKTLEVRDTLPDAGFGEPVEISRERSPIKDPFASENKPSKVIQVSSIEVDTSYRQLAKIPKGFTGYKIEIQNVEKPLPSDHDIFFQHGNLAMEKVSETEYSYTLGTFNDMDTASIFMQDFLLQRYPNARVIEYQEGERLY